MLLWRPKFIPTELLKSMQMLSIKETSLESLSFTFVA